MAEVVAALRHDFIQAAAAKDEAAGTSKKQRAEARESAEVATRTVRSRSWLPVLIEVNSHGEVTSVQLDTPEGAVHISSPDIDTKWQQMQPVVTHQVAAPVPAVDVHVATTAAPPHRHAVPTAAGATTAAPPRRHAVPTAAGATSGSGNGGGGGAKAATAATSAQALPLQGKRPVAGKARIRGGGLSVSVWPGVSADKHQMDDAAASGRATKVRRIQSAANGAAVG